jgi:hypothetical protein
MVIKEVLKNRSRDSNEAVLNPNNNTSIYRRSLDPSLFPIYSEKAIFGRLRVFQLAAGDPADSSPSDGRLGGGRTGNPWIPAGL